MRVSKDCYFSKAVKGKFCIEHKIQISPDELPKKSQNGIYFGVSDDKMIFCYFQICAEPKPVYQVRAVKNARNILGWDLYEVMTGRQFVLDTLTGQCVTQTMLVNVFGLTRTQAKDAINYGIIDYDVLKLIHGKLYTRMPTFGED